MKFLGLRFYYIPDCYMAQIEGRRSIVSFRLRYTCFGIAYPAKWHNKAWLRCPLWVRYLPHFSLGLFYHTAQCDQWMIFNIEVGERRFGFKTAGERTSKWMLKV